MPRRAVGLTTIIAAAGAALAIVVVVMVNGSNGVPPLNAQPINPPVSAPATAGRDSLGNLVSVPEGVDQRW